MRSLREFGAERILNLSSISLTGDVAYSVVRGAALRQRSVYHPYFLARVAPIAYQFIPRVFENLAAYLYARV